MSSRQGQVQLFHDQLNDTNFESTYDTFVIGVNDKLMNPYQESRWRKGYKDHNCLLICSFDWKWDSRDYPWTLESS